MAGHELFAATQASGSRNNHLALKRAAEGSPREETKSSTHIGALLWDRAMLDPVMQHFGIGMCFVIFQQVFLRVHIGF